jgi:hypothetical protein
MLIIPKHQCRETREFNFLFFLRTYSLSPTSNERQEIKRKGGFLLNIEAEVKLAKKGDREAFCG